MDGTIQEENESNKRTYRTVDIFYVLYYNQKKEGVKAINEKLEDSGKNERDTCVRTGGVI